MAYGDIDAGMTEAEKQHLAELEVTCEKQSKELAWYHTLKIERHEHDNMTSIDGGEKAQMLHEMWEDNVRLKEELAATPLSKEDTGALFGVVPMNSAQQGVELLLRGKQIDKLTATCEEQSDRISKQGKRIAEQAQEITRLNDNLSEEKYHHEIEKDYDRDANARITELEENLRFAGEVVKATKSMAETCLEERKMGNGGCGACSICCKEYRAERDKLREAGQALMVALKRYPEAATPGMPLHGERTRGIESAYKAIWAAVGKGGGG